MAGRTSATLEQTVKLVAHAGGNAKDVIADVDDEAPVRHAVEVAAGGAGRLNVAVSGARVDRGNDSHPPRSVFAERAAEALLGETHV